MDQFDGMLWIISSLLMMAGVLVLAYYTTRWLGRRSLAQSGSKMIQVLDRAPLGQDKSLVVVKVAGKVMLLGASQNSIRKLCDLENVEDYLPAEKVPESFSELLKTTMKTRFPAKSSEHGEGERDE